MKNSVAHKISCKTTSFKAGFSLIEVLFSLFVLMLGTSAIFLLLTRSIGASVEAKNELIASGLAQEGIELVRNYKDNYYDFSTQVASSDTSIDFAADPGTLFSQFVASSGSGTHKNNDSAKRLYVNCLNIYTHNSSDAACGAVASSASKFYRKIRLSVASVNGKNETTVYSIVSWNPVTPFPFATGSNPSSCTIANKCMLVISKFIDN